MSGGRTRTKSPGFRSYTFPSSLLVVSRPAMLTTLASVLAVGTAGAFAHTVTSSNGVTFSCPTTEQSVQAYAPLCEFVSPIATLPLYAGLDPIALKSSIAFSMSFVHTARVLCMYYV